MLSQLDTENADRDLKTAAVLCLTHTPDAANPRFCQAVVYLGDGAKALDGTGGNFTIRVDLGSQSGPVKTQVIAATKTRGWLYSDLFMVPANTAVTVYVQSPNVADADVDTTAYLFGFDTTVDVGKINGVTLGAQAGTNFNAIYQNAGILTVHTLDDLKQVIEVIQRIQS